MYKNYYWTLHQCNRASFGTQLGKGLMQTNIYIFTLVISGQNQELHTHTVSLFNSYILYHTLTLMGRFGFFPQTLNFHDMMDSTPLLCA